MVDNTAYLTETSKVLLNNKEFTIVNHKPILPKDEERETKKAVESTLYNIFKKYM